MKLDDEQNGLARVDKTATNMTPTPPRRSVPMKRTTERPTTEQLTPSPLAGTEKIKAELESALTPIFEEIEHSERSAAAMVVSNLIPRAIAARSAQSEARIAANVKELVEEVAAESLETFSAVDSSNSVMLVSLADTIFGQLFPGELAI